MKCNKEKITINKHKEYNDKCEFALNEVTYEGKSIFTYLQC